MNNKVLIIGGTAPICKDIVKILEENNYKIDLMTYRQKEKINNLYNWQYLDLNDYESTNNFINNINKNYYNKIILMSSSSPSHLDILNTSRNELINFYSNFFVNYMILIVGLLPSMTDDGQIIYISSVAANKPNNNVNYATSKGSMQMFITSMSTKIKFQQAIFSISPGLIYDSPAFYHNDPSNYQNDPSKLATKNQIAEIILNANVDYNGKIIHIGC